MARIQSNSELRIPSSLLASALAEKRIKELRLLAAAKLEGHRSEIRILCGDLKIHPRTCGRLIKTIVEHGWSGTDGTYLFPRSWGRLRLKRKGGLYIVRQPRNIKRFECLCFALVLKKVLSSKAGPRPKKGRSQPMDLPTTYLHKALGISERRFERLKASAQRYKYLSVKPQFTIVGKAEEYLALRKYLIDRPVFVRGKHTVVPGLSKIKVLI